ncbi:MAG: recombinase zinc beta ribbon domain-containing protein [Chromatiaceae bacterium]|nr:recombinase zinc beta ribbon domain-containing protein [Chromatiaceae bacterium]
MTLVTGKSGRYRYYKCTTRRSKGNDACPSKNYPMQQLDELILGHVVERVLTPERLRQLFVEVRKRVNATKKTSGESVKTLEQELKGVEMRLARLYEAIEAGAIDINDDSLKQRVRRLKAAKESTLMELARARAKKHMPAPRILPSTLESFSTALRKRLVNRDTAFAKRYLGVLLDEIVISDNEAAIRSGYGPLAAAVEKSKEGTLDQVPSFVGEWRAWRDSNSRPLGS